MSDKKNPPEHDQRETMPPISFLLTNTVLGTLGGALFGVGFGALASFFEGGPELMTGIRESWLWFAIMGAFLGVGASFPYRG